MSISTVGSMIQVLGLRWGPHDLPSGRLRRIGILDGRLAVVRGVGHCAGATSGGITGSPAGSRMARVVTAKPDEKRWTSPRTPPLRWGLRWDLTGPRGRRIFERRRLDLLSFAQWALHGVHHERRN